MNSEQLPNASVNPIVSISLTSSSPAQEASHPSLERGRRTILGGWIISMIGVVFFCLVMSGSEHQPDISSVLAALAVTAAGVGLWFVGCVSFLNEAASSTEPVD